MQLYWHDTLQQILLMCWQCVEATSGFIFTFSPLIRSKCCGSFQEMKQHHECIWRAWVKCDALTQMCCRSLLFTGYSTQFVPTSFTAHSMSMLVTIPHWLSYEATKTRLSMSSYRVLTSLTPLLKYPTFLRSINITGSDCGGDNNWISTKRKFHQSFNSVFLFRLGFVALC